MADELVVEKKARKNSEFWAVVTNPEGDSHKPVIIKESSKKRLEAALQGHAAGDVIWAFRGKVRTLTAQAKVCF
jgi:hypothetical protein